MNPPIAEAVLEIQAHKLNIVRLENDIKSRTAEIAWRKRRIELLTQEFTALKKTSSKGKGKRNAGKVVKSRRNRV